MAFINSYASPSDLYSRYDCRLLADLVQDTNARLGSDTNVGLIQTALNTNQNLLDILADATGIVNSAVLVGQRYTVTQLEHLTDVDQQFLIRITCSLAYGMLVLRRGEIKQNDLPPEYKEAKETLELLRSGAAVFNILSAEQAGVAGAYFPSAFQYAYLNMFRDFATPRYFSSRRLQRPSGPS